MREINALECRRHQTPDSVMSLRVTFEIDDRDLEHFRLVMREARKTVARMPPETIVATASAQLNRVAASSSPGFIQERFARLRLMIDMLTDLDWRLPHEVAMRVLNALAYFTEPDDLIPDDIPGLGLLDDAIMVELVMRELRHEIEAYADFCEFRELRKPAARAATGRDRVLEKRRAELHSRMRRRSDKEQDDAPIRLLN